MGNEDIQKKMDFIIEQQAQFSTDIGELKDTVRELKDTVKDLTGAVSQMAGVLNETDAGPSEALDGRRTHRL